MMDRKEAADLLDNLIGMVEDSHGADYDTALRRGIGALTADGDTIYRQAAIDAMLKLQAEDEEAYGCSIPEGFDGDRAKEALEQLPSAQPERILYANMSDAEFERWLYEHGICNPNIHESIPCDAVPLLIDNAISELPSAQPEIIRCKDCKHQVKEWRDDKRLKDKSYWVYGCKLISDVCGYWAGFGQDDGFCSEAERRTDETTI